MMNKILITGGAGYLGSTLVRKLLQKNYKIIVLDKFLYNERALNKIEFHPNLTVIKEGIENKTILDKIIKKTDGVIHLAVIVGDKAYENSRSSYNTNYNGTKTITDLAKKYKINKFIFASTCSIYGNQKKNLCK